MFKKLLNFFQLSDRGGNLSLTNIALIIVLIKIALAPFDYTGAVILLPVIASYMHKRYESNKAFSKEVNPAPSIDLAPIHEQIDSVNKQVAAVAASHESISKLAEDTKKLLSQANLAHAFTPRNKRGE